MASIAFMRRRRLMRLNDDQSKSDDHCFNESYCAHEMAPIKFEPKTLYVETVTNHRATPKSHPATPKGGKRNYQVPGKLSKTQPKVELSHLKATIKSKVVPKYDSKLEIKLTDKVNYFMRKLKSSKRIETKPVKSPNCFVKIDFKSNWGKLLARDTVF